jgi:hypothetical protein
MRKTTVVALALLACLAPPAAASTQRLEGPGFRTRVADGWPVAPKTEKRVTTFTPTSPGTTVDDVGIPAPGGIAVTVGTMRTSTFRRLLHRRAPRSPIAVLRALIGTPRAATDRKTTKRPHVTALGHRRAGAATFAYTYQGRRILQRDVVARHGNRVYWIELDVEGRLADAGQAGLRTVLRGWHWR